MDDALSPDPARGTRTRSSSGTRSRSASLREVRGDDPQLVSKLRIEERELEAGGLNQTTSQQPEGARRTVSLTKQGSPGRSTCDPRPCS